MNLIFKEGQANIYAYILTEALIEFYFPLMFNSFFEAAVIVTGFTPATELFAPTEVLVAFFFTVVF